MRDAGGQMNGTKQAKRARRRTKYGHSAPLDAGWGSGRREQDNQSPLIDPALWRVVAMDAQGS